jgi:hypothetical protein
MRISVKSSCNTPKSLYVRAMMVYFNVIKNVFVVHNTCMLCNVCNAMLEFEYKQTSLLDLKEKADFRDDGKKTIAL